MLYRYKIEEYNAKMNCSCSNFSSRWEPYKPLQASVLNNKNVLYMCII